MQSWMETRLLSASNHASEQMSYTSAQWRSANPRGFNQEEEPMDITQEATCKLCGKVMPVKA